MSPGNAHREAHEGSRQRIGIDVLARAERPEARVNQSNQSNQSNCIFSLSPLTSNLMASPFPLASRLYPPTSPFLSLIFDPSIFSL